MTDGDGLVQVHELDGILGLEGGTCYRMLKRGVFYATKIKNSVWVVEEREMAFVIDRILRYRSRRPWYPQENLTVAQAAQVLQVTEPAIYGLLSRGELERALNEHWRMATKESVNRLCRRKGLREVA